MFSDLEIAVANVPAQTEAVVTTLGVDVGSDSTELIETTCSDRPRLARRIQRAARAPHLANITPAGLREKLAQHGLPDDQLGSGETIELDDREDVEIFLDMLEQRYYEADFTGEHMRADRFSQRPSP